MTLLAVWSPSADRSSCTEGSVAEVCLHPTDKNRASISHRQFTNRFNRSINCITCSSRRL